MFSDREIVFKVTGGTYNFYTCMQLTSAVFEAVISAVSAAPAAEVRIFFMF